MRTNWFGVEVGKKEASKDGAGDHLDLWNVHNHRDSEEDVGGSGIMRDVLSQLRNIKTH